MTLLQAALIRLGPGGDFVREYATCPDQPARLVLRRTSAAARASTGPWSPGGPPSAPPDRFSSVARLVGVLSACLHRLEGQRTAIANSINADLCLPRLSSRV